jgi:hypothetical protein
MKRTLIALALVAASAGVASAQSSVDPNLAPGANPKGMKADSNATAEHAAVKAKLEAAGFHGVHNLTRTPDGTWTGRAMRNNLDIAVQMDINGNIISN